jgi:hypothetical protein
VKGIEGSRGKEQGCTIRARQEILVHANEGVKMEAEERGGSIAPCIAPRAPN